MSNSLQNIAVVFAVRIFARPVGRWFKLRESKPKKPRANPLLEATYRKRRKILPAHNELVVSEFTAALYSPHMVKLVQKLYV